MWEPVISKYLEYLQFEVEASGYKINDYRKKLRWLSKRCPLPFSLKEIRDVIVTLKKKGVSPAYINYWITLINSFVRWCQLEKMDQEDICDLLNSLRPHEDRSPDANDVLSVQEITNLITNPPRVNIQMESMREYFTGLDSMYSLLFEFIYKTGCRSGEAISLRKKHFNFSTHSVTFYETKTGDNRTVAIPPDMECRLIDFVKGITDTGYLFTGKNKVKEGPLSQEMLNRMFKTRAKAWGIDRSVHIHMLRHSCITHMLLNGAPLPVLQTIVGHKRLATTQLYTHIMVENQREAMIKYNPLIRTTNDPKLILKRLEDSFSEMKLDEDPRFTYHFEKGSNSLRVEVYVK